MIDLKEYAEFIDKESGYTCENINHKLIHFLEDNEWFGISPECKEGKVYISEEQKQLYTDKFLYFIANQDTENKDVILLTKLRESFPETTAKLEEFFNVTGIESNARFYITDFLLYRLTQDVFLMNDNAIHNLVEHATADLTKSHGNILTFFFSWLKSTCKTAYFNDYIMSKRYTLGDKNSAYSFDEYLEIMYYLYNEEYITENEMIYSAAKSKNYADTWLYLAIHFICSLRYTDICRIPHPILPREPEQILEDILCDQFTEADARGVLSTVIWRLCAIPLVPNKTSDIAGVSSIKFTVPESCEVLIGTLFAICEAHRIIKDVPDDAPLIRRIQTYDEITRYMGDEIGGLFLTANFHARSANKSYLQASFLLSDEILGQDENMPYIRGYMMAALARSHKGSFGEFANTTMTYLKDAKLSGLTPEFVAKELFERGVLSFIPSMLLKMITNGEYNKLSVEKQTQMHHLLDMTPSEVEHTVAVTTKAKKRALDVATALMNQKGENEVLTALHRIGTGVAFSKQPECMCLMTSLGKLCQFDERRTCIGCQYEIGTKSTIILMVDEYNRLYTLYNNAGSAHEKNKYKKFLTDVVLPSLSETLECFKDQYGQESYEAIEQLIKENTI